MGSPENATMWKPRKRSFHGLRARYLQKLLEGENGGHNESEMCALTTLSIEDGFNIGSTSVIERRKISCGVLLLLSHFQFNKTTFATVFFTIFL